MKKEKLELAMRISESTIQNILNESTVSADIAQFPNLLSKIIRKVYTKSLIGEISDIQPLTGPVGKIATVFSGYGGRETSGLKLDTSALIAVDDITNFNVDDVIETDNATAVIEYIEENYILAKNIAKTNVSATGKFATGDVLTDSTTSQTANIIGVYSNRIYAAKVLRNYSGNLLTMEYATTRDLDFEVKMSTIEAVSHKMRAVVTQEVITDMKNMYGVDVAEDLLAQEFANEMIQEIDSELITYLRTAASIVCPDLVLRYSYGTTGGDISGVANDIYSNIYKAAQQIATDTRRRQNFFIIADPLTVSLLMVSPLHIQPATENDNTYYKGKLGSLYDLYVDPYANDTYCLIGYTNGFGGTGDSGLIYSPYMNQIIEATDPNSGKSLFYNIVRYGYTIHPQDTGTGNADSIFFKTFNIDMSGLQNFQKFDALIP